MSWIKITMKYDGTCVVCNKKIRVKEIGLWLKGESKVKHEKCDEENKDGDHPKLWRHFAFAMGSSKKEIESVEEEKFTTELIENFFKNGRASYAEGLASLYTYERQIPEIAETKIRGLKNHYGVTSKEGLEFFEVHKTADVYHRKACEELLDGLSKDEKEKAEKSALSTAKYLWNFLTGMAVKHNIPMQVAA